LRAAHPYEEPAMDVVRLEPVGDGMGGSVDGQSSL